MPLNAISTLGLLVILAIAWLSSTDRKAVSWRVVGGGLALQIGLGVVILKTEVGLLFFEYVTLAFNKIMKFADDGSSFVFGRLALGPEHGDASLGFFFAFQVLPTVILVSSLMGVLYHLGVMQWVVYGFARVMTLVMGSSGAESLSCAANVFAGQTEAPLVVKPYVPSMTRSELMTLMTGGFATIAGGVMVAYARMGVDPGHLLSASIMAAPGAILLAKVMVPETEEPETRGEVKMKVERVSANVIDAAASGAADGVMLAINVAAMLLAFVALIALFNYVLGQAGALAAWAFGFDDPGLSLKLVFGYLLWPLAFVMGVPADDCATFANLVGEKISINEFVAYISLRKAYPESIDVAALDPATRANVLSPRGITIATYALCGFANFASIAIQLGGIGSIAPNKRHELARLGLRAMFAGALASLMVACIAGMLITEAESDWGFTKHLARSRIEAGKLDGARAAVDAFLKKHQDSSLAAKAKRLSEEVDLRARLAEAKRLAAAGDAAGARAVVSPLVSAPFDEVAAGARALLESLPAPPVEKKEEKR